MTRRSRLSFGAALAFLLLAASLSTCAQTVVLEDQIDGGGTSPANDGSFGDGHCLGGQTQTLPFKTLSPEVIVALDRSSAMTGQLQTVLNALVAQVQSYQNVIRFGFVDFPDNLDVCPNSCCTSTLTPPPPMPTSYTYFTTPAYFCNTQNQVCPTSTSRPTEVALKSCANNYSPSNDFQMYGRYVLLITDGDPVGGDLGGTCGDDMKGDCADAEMEVGTLHSLNVQTFIVDLGAQSNANDCLHELATAQGMNGTYYYSNGLNNDLTTITGTIAMAACHLSLTTPPDDPSEVSIKYFGTPIPQDRSNGWSFDNGSSVGITLNGPACRDFITNRSYPQGLVVSSGCSTGHPNGQTGP